MSENDISYVPLEGQEIFHRSQARVKAMLGGVGSGKTAGGAHEAVKHALGQPGQSGMIVAPTFNMLRRLSLPAFLDAMPEAAVKIHHKGDKCITLHNESKIWYASTERPGSLDGSNLSWFWMDEPRYSPLEAFEIMLARLREPGALLHQGWLTSTPEMNWLFDLFGSESRQEGFDLVRVHTEDNSYNPDDYIDQMKRTYSDSTFAMYVGGEFIHLSGGVFPQFDSKVHIQDLQYEAKLPVSIAVDFGYRFPSVLYFQHLPHCRTHKTTNCVHIIDEDQPENCPTVELMKVIERKFTRKRWRKGVAYVDPAGASSNVTVGYSDVQVMKGYPYQWECRCVWDIRKRHIPWGIDQMRLILKPYGSPPRLYIDKGCKDDRGIVRAFQASKYPDKNKIAGKRDVQPTKDIYTHARDACRYLVIGLDGKGAERL